MGLRALQIAIFIVMATIIGTLVQGIFPGYIGDAPNYNVTDIIAKTDAATGAGAPTDGIPILGDLVTVANSFMASLGALGALIKNIVYSYGFFKWLGLSNELAIIGQLFTGLIYVLTLIELKTGRSVE